MGFIEKLRQTIREQGRLGKGKHGPRARKAYQDFLSGKDVGSMFRPYKR